VTPLTGAAPEGDGGVRAVGVAARGEGKGAGPSREIVGPRASLKQRRSRSEKTLSIAIAAAILFLPVWFVADVAYVGSLPESAYYHYTFELSVSNASSNFSLMLPLPIVTDGSVLHGLNFSDPRFGDIRVVDTMYGKALNVRSDSGFAIGMDWDFDARKDSPDRRSDGCPMLSMSTMVPRNPDCASTSSGRQSVWIWSDVGGLEVVVSFERMFKNWKAGDGFFVSGYSRGGGGYNLRITNETSLGWGRCPFDVTEIMVE